MHLEGRQEIDAGREHVWQALLDPRQVAGCIPGRPEIQVIDDRHMRARVSVGGGFFKTTAVIDVTLTHLDAPSHATADATASAMGGGATATANVDLVETAPGRTQLTWEAEVQLTGLLSGFASSVEAPAQRGIADTFACLKARIEAAESAQAAS